MNAMQKMISLCSFFLSSSHHTKGSNKFLATFSPRRARLATLIAVLASVVGAGTALVAGPGTAFAADETFTKTSVITVPGGLNSFDIGFVDPKIGYYFLADRTNSTVDQVDTSDNDLIAQLAKGAFVGLQAGSDTSGPNGVITANNHTEVWAADGVLCADAQNACTTATTPATQTSQVVVINIDSGEVVTNIDTGGQRRADELCEDPQHHVVLVANDDPVDLFLTFISTQTYSVVGKVYLDGTDPNAKKIKATNGIEQCQWSPRTKKFYLAVPEVNGDGITANQQPGVVLQINPSSMKVEKVFPIDFGFVAATAATAAANAVPATADCLGPQGLAIGPNRQILLGCSNSGKGSVIISEIFGDEILNLPGFNGNDEVWYNPGDNHYFLAGSNHKIGSSSLPILGVVDVKADLVNGDSPVATLSSSHSVAADPVYNQVYVPVKAAGTLCGALNGCIAVFTAANDDPGLCNKKGKKSDPVFLPTVCP